MLPPRYICNVDADSIQRKGWEIKDSVIYFTQEEADRATLSSLNVIDNTIRYAQELETIV